MKGTDTFVCSCGARLSPLEAAAHLANVHGMDPAAARRWVRQVQAERPH